jgi:hypothetical protein
VQGEEEQAKGDQRLPGEDVARLRVGPVEQQLDAENDRGDDR